MSINAKDIQQKLWDILGKPEKKQFAFTALQNGTRIGRGQGNYWFNDNGDGASDDDKKGKKGKKDGDKKDDDKKDDDKKDDDKKDDDKKDDDKKDDDKKDDDGDPRQDPRQPPKVGDNIPGLKGLKDCDSGQCVNVNFTMPVMPPEGWNSACEPPKQTPSKCRYMLVTKDTYKGTTKTQWFDDRFEAFAAAKSFFYSSSYPFMSFGSDEEARNGHPVFSISRPRNDHLIGTHFIFYDNQDGNDFYYFVDSNGWYSRDQECADYYDLPYGGATIWEVYAESSAWLDRRQAGELRAQVFGIKPTDPRYEAATPYASSGTCIELEAKNGGFEMPCDGKYYHHAPDVLKGNNAAVALCDADGNRVVVERWGNGWRYTTATHTVRVDGDGNVTSVQPV